MAKIIWPMLGWGRERDNRLNKWVDFFNVSDKRDRKILAQDHSACGGGYSCQSMECSEIGVL